MEEQRLSQSYTSLSSIGSELGDKTITDAQKLVAGMSADAEEAGELMRMLGIHPVQSD